MIVLGLVHGHWNEAGDRLLSTDVWGTDGSVTAITVKTAIAATGFAALNYAGFSCAGGLRGGVRERPSPPGADHAVGLRRLRGHPDGLHHGRVPRRAVTQRILTSPTPLADLIGQLGGAWLNKVVNILLFLVISQATMLFVVFVSRQLWSSGRDERMADADQPRAGLAAPALQEPVDRHRPVRRDHDSARVRRRR
ncbi:hypothetical protein ACRAWF_32860 [Streptomyces sp. L7]